MRKYLAFLFLFAWPADASVRCSTSPCIDSAGIDATANTAWTGTNSFLDESFTILDTASPTKVFNIETGSITAGQTRVWTAPDRSDTFAGLGGQTFTGAQAFSGFLSFSGSGAWALDLFKIRDGGEDTNIIISTLSDVSAERTWRFNFGDANRTLTMTADASLNQSVLTTSTPTFVGLLVSATAFAALGTPSNGTVLYCNDCTIANPCAGSGTGALAKRLNGAWVCN